MPRPRLPIACALLTLLLFTPAARAAEGETRPSGAAAPTAVTTFAPGRVIVEWAAGASRSDRVAARQDADATSMRPLGDPLFQLLAVDPGQSASDVLDSLRSDPAVQAASRDGYSSLDSVPNDPLFGELWGLSNSGSGIDGFSGAIAGADVNAPLAWDRTTGSPSTVIADLDSGYRFDSPDLGPVAWTNPGEIAGNGTDDDGNGFVDDVHGYDFVGASADSPTSDNDPTDDNLISGGHGVHTAGTMGAAGNNGVGITGVAQNVRIMPLRVCANSVVSENETRCPFSSQIAAINYAGEMGARAANMSLGGTTFNAPERDAIAANPQTLFVISAGNDGVDNDFEPHYPCNYDPLAEGKSGVDNVICVAATDQADQLAGFSDWGASSVDLGAPGTETLSTFPVLTPTPIDDFEANDFSSKWETTAGTGMGLAAAGDGPLTSFGMNDSPGSAPAPSSVHQSTLTNGIPIPTGSGSCKLSGLRFRRADSGSSFSYSVLSDGSPVFTNTSSTSTSGSEMAPFNTVPITGLGGHSVKVSFGYNAGPSPTAANGIWLDDLKLTCYAPLSTPPGYEFLEGTSMAAPHVTGAAGLLFSLKPTATVTEVRDALLDGVDAIPSLAGKTTSGGRLDVARAMEKLPPSAPQLESTLPASPANDNNPKIRGTAEAGSTIRIYSGTTCSGSPIATGSGAALESPGITVGVLDNSISHFSATATVSATNESACSNSIAYTEVTPIVEELPRGTVEKTEAAIRAANPPAAAAQPSKPACKVPALAGKSLGQAKAKLAAAHCTLGAVSKPKARKGHVVPPLVVKSSNPAPGSLSSSKVDITLGPKPKPKKHHH
ncbi:MAG TPA: S8 family serine peptidase [Solirubrobacterales bacterium]|jgi:subtilisin family serine protease|nr:S8 family serine peptidase [Solirubrobacterales bacterium]